MPSATVKQLEKMGQLASATGRQALETAHAAVVAERKELAHPGPGRPKKSPTRDAVIALQYGALKDMQPTVLARIQKALENENDPLHALVMTKLMAAVVPAGFWDALGKQEFVEEAEGKTAPSITIVIGQKAGAETAVDVVSEQ